MPTPAGIIDFFLHPPLGLQVRSTTSPSPLSNPFAFGLHSLLPTVGLASSYGLYWELDSIGPDFGELIGALPERQQRIMQITVQHTLADATILTDQVVDVTFDKGFVLWENSLPSSLTLYVEPTVAVNLWWLIGQ